MQQFSRGGGIFLFFCMSFSHFFKGETFFLFFLHVFFLICFFTTGLMFSCYLLLIQDAPGLAEVLLSRSFGLFGDFECFLVSSLQVATFWFLGSFSGFVGFSLFSCVFGFC